MTDSKPLDAALWDDGIAIGDDFYHHVNARWLAANPVPPEYPMWGAYLELDHNNKELTRRLLERAAAAGPDADPVTRLAGDFYAAGMDEAAIAAAGAEPLRPFLDRIDAVGSIDDLRALNLDLHRDGAGALFGIGVESDFEDAAVHLAYLGQAGLGLPERSYYLNDDERSVGLRSAYTAHVAAQLRNLGAEEGPAAASADAILAFERRLAEASLSPEQRRDPKLTLNRYEVAALDGVMPGYRLGAYLRDVGVTSDTVSIDSAAFFTALDGVLADTPVDTLRDVLRWHLVRSAASSLAPAFDEENFAFYGRIARRPAGPAAALEARRGRGRPPTSARRSRQLFVHETFPPEAKARVETLVEHLLSAMGRAIRGNTWMTEATREEALRKLAAFGYKIGYPDRWRDYSGLPSIATATSRAGSRPPRSRCAASSRSSARPSTSTSGRCPPHVVNAYYHPIRNEIVFPAGILQPPFFHADADDAVNYGGIGTVIGHEITHGFDDAGSQFDTSGAFRNWWTEEDRAEFERRANVIVEQFNAYTIADDVTVNGRLTLGENIADLGGTTIALDAMHEAVDADAPLVDGLTPDQRFFLAYATMWRMGYTEAAARMLANVDSHAPSQYRVNGPLSNTPAFAAAFAVADGAPMALPDDRRAKVW